MKSLWVLALVFLAGCATAPKQYDLQTSYDIPAEYDVVWSALIEFFAENSIPIETVEKDSGFIAAKWGNGSMPAAWFDCGSNGILIVEDRSGKFNIHVTDGDSGVRVRVTTVYAVLRSFGDSVSWSACNSTGEFESYVAEQIYAKTGVDLK